MKYRIQLLAKVSVKWLHKVLILSHREVVITLKNSNWYILNIRLIYWKSFTDTQYFRCVVTMVWIIKTCKHVYNFQSKIAHIKLKGGFYTSVYLKGLQKFVHYPVQEIFTRKHEELLKILPLSDISRADKQRTPWMQDSKICAPVDPSWLLLRSRSTSEIFSLHANPSRTFLKGKIEEILFTLWLIIITFITIMLNNSAKVLCKNYKLWPSLSYSLLSFNTSVS